MNVIDRLTQEGIWHYFNIFLQSAVPTLGLSGVVAIKCSDFRLMLLLSSFVVLRAFLKQL